MAEYRHIDGRDGLQSLARTFLELAKRDLEGKFRVGHKDSRVNVINSARNFFEDETGYRDMFELIANYKGENDGKDTFQLCRCE